MGLPGSGLRSWAFVLTVVLVAAGGCAVGPTPGGRLLLDGNAAAAVGVLARETQLRPHDVSIRRNYAIALWRTGHTGDALDELRGARRDDPDDPRTLYLLGQVAEASGHLDEALGAFGAYLAHTDAHAPAVRKKLQTIGEALTRTRVRAALAEERTLGAPTAEDTALAVPPFANLSKDPAWEPLSRGLAAVMITDLSRLHTLRIVERARLGVIRDELRRAGMTTGDAGDATPVVDPATAPRLAALVGARRFAQGTFAMTGDEAVQLDTFIVDGASGESTPAGAPVPGPVREVLALQKQLLLQIVDALGIALTDAQRRAIAPVATQSFDAFLAYSQGLLLEDEGRPADALEAYRLATSLDPAFRLAADRRDVLGADPDAVGAAVQAASAATPPSGDADDRGVRTAAQLGLGPLPEGDGGGDLSPALKVEPTVDVVVTGDLPSPGRSR